MNYVRNTYREIKEWWFDRKIQRKCSSPRAFLRWIDDQPPNARWYWANDPGYAKMNPVIDWMRHWAFDGTADLRWEHGEHQHPLPHSVEFCSPSGLWHELPLEKYPWLHAIHVAMYYHHLHSMQMIASGAMSAAHIRRYVAQWTR